MKNYNVVTSKSGRGRLLEVWSFTRGFYCRDLTRENLVFWRGGRLWEVVAYEMWSHMEVRMYWF